MTGFGTGTLGAGTFGESESSAFELLTAPWMLPPWVSRLRGTWVMTFLESVAVEIDTMQAQHRAIAAQAFIPTADFALDSWERQLGLAVEASLSDAARQDRALARRRGLSGPIGLYLQRLVEVAVGGTALPTLFIGPGLWAVFKLADNGWPGDAAFLEAERRLWLSGPAAFGNFVAAYDSALGLTFEQLDLMAFEALDVLTFREMNGVPLPLPTGEYMVGLGLWSEEN